MTTPSRNEMIDKIYEVMLPTTTLVGYAYKVDRDIYRVKIGDILKYIDTHHNRENGSRNMQAHKKLITQVYYHFVPRGLDLSINAQDDECIAFIFGLLP